MAYQVARPPEYQFVTLVRLAQNGEGALLEKGDAVMTSIDSHWIPEIVSQFRKEYSHVPRFNMNTSSVEGGVVLFSSVGKVELAEEIRWFHKALADRLLDSQSVLETLTRKKLETQVEVAERGLNALKGVEASNLTDTGLLETLVSLKGRLIGMQPAEMRVVAQRKEGVVGLGLGIRLVLTVFQAFVLSVFVVLLYHFIRRVNRAVQVDEERS
ncbi:hypothetical protein KUV35_05730 [Marinobacter salsuginis]|uniref:hypothetical protein n=1 Tax=Marinobacter salsuginis TaxID=418719 RepID=UPI001C966A7C|nr:hypothetical protein [Marinobacter salsuginis]MBY6070780.1 hypothetical protein [Marinobacter salsuginis]